jgi:UDP-glucose 4-epimerase
MKMLITGYKGLLGSTVARQMNGIATEVLAVSSENRYETWPKDRKTRLLKDLDYVFWFGSSITPANAKSSVEEQSLEIHEFKLLIDDLKQLSDRAVVILASSGGSLYDKNEPPYSESSEIVPNNTYGTFKLQQEELLRSETDLRHLILRFSNIYGIGQRTGRGLGVIAEWCKASYFDRAVEVFGSLEKERDFVYVEDAVAAIARYVRLPRKPDTYCK